MGRSQPSDDARRRRILDVSLELFLDVGVEASAIEDVRRRSGASVGSLYHRFGSKEGIAAAVYVDALHHYQREFVAALSRARDARDGVRSAERHRPTRHGHVGRMTGPAVIPWRFGTSRP